MAIIEYIDIYYSPIGQHEVKALPKKWTDPMRVGRRKKDGIGYDLRTKSGKAAAKAMVELNNWLVSEWRAGRI